MILLCAEEAGVGPAGAYTDVHRAAAARAEPGVFGARFVLVNAYIHAAALELDAEPTPLAAVSQQAGRVIPYHDIDERFFSIGHPMNNIGRRSLGPKPAC